MVTNKTVLASIGNVTVNSHSEAMICQDLKTLNHLRNMYFGDYWLNFSFPTVLLQISIIFIISRLVYSVIRPFRQGLINAQIMTGIILGASFLGHYFPSTEALFPPEGMIHLHTLAHFGVMFHLFLVSLQMDTSIIWSSGKRSTLVGIISAVSPTIVSGLIFLGIKGLNIHLSPESSIYPIFMIHSLSAFPGVVNLLADLNILNSDLGRLATETSMINSMFCFFMFEICVKFIVYPPMMAFQSILCAFLFLIIHIYVTRPYILWMTSYIQHGKPLMHHHFCIIILILLVSTFLGEILGQDLAFGPVVLGAILPDRNSLVVELETKLDAFFNGLLLPIFCAICGLHANFFNNGGDSEAAIEILIIVTYLAKFTGILVSAVSCGEEYMNAICLSLILSCKGVIDLIVYLHLKEGQMLDELSFNLLLINILVITGIARPVVGYLYDPSKRYSTWKRRTLAASIHNRQLRALVCIHSPDNVTPLIDLLEAFNPTSTNPMVVFVLHLKKLTGKASAAVLADHHIGKHRSNKAFAQKNYSLEKANASGYNSMHSLNAFSQFEERFQGCATINNFTAIAPYASMHVDACTIALDKRTSIMIIPFHKSWSVDGKVGSISPYIRRVNYNIAEQAPCSVGVLIDRRTTTTNTSLQSTHSFYQVGILFSGGDDDFEALAVGSKLAENPDVSLLIVVLKDSLHEDHEKENHFKHMKNLERIKYEEFIVENGDDTTQIIRSKEKELDLLIVGRHHHPSSAFALGLGEWKECPELGLIGDMLSSPYFSVSVLVVIQQQLKHETMGFSFDFLRNVNSMESRQSCSYDSPKFSM